MRTIVQIPEGRFLRSIFRRLLFFRFFHLRGRKNVIGFVIFIFQIKQSLDVENREHHRKGNQNDQNRINPVDGEPSVLRAPRYTMLQTARRPNCKYKSSCIPARTRC